VRASRERPPDPGTPIAMTCACDYNVKTDFVTGFLWKAAFSEVNRASISAGLWTWRRLELNKVVENRCDIEQF
jgi:hypothetical protein